MERVCLDGGALSIEQVAAVAGGARVEVSPEAVEKARQSRAALERLEAAGEQIYGVNTGFGPLKSEIIPDKDRIRLQENLIRSHAAGVGEPLGVEETRAAMLLTAACLLRGHSGVGPEAAQLIAACLNAQVHPLVPSRGSLGASGDLAPLSHIAMGLIGEGPALDSGDSIAALMNRAGIEPLKLTSKLGLSLINGTHVHTAISALLIVQAERIAKAADVACAMNLEAMLCSIRPFSEKVHALRPHPHQARVGRNVTKLVKNSELIPSHAGCGEVQDAYSVRCAPQVHGAARQAIAHAREVTEVELGSVTDNPLLLGDDIVSAGHFHGEPVGLALDYFKIGTAELAAISERRTERALNKEYNRGLPPFLAHNPGLNSGLMVCQYTAAALVSENKVLSHPSCVDSITTGAHQEDHVSMAMNAALHAQDVVANTRYVIAIELIVAAQALDARREIQPHEPGAGVRAAWSAVREAVPYVETDRAMSEEVQNLDLGRVVEAVESEVGGLE
ncbi:MAG: histidine ammonia-lyase [Armatimonadetes bacterium]|nr:histidine ammonia-lyase [Armatimonadota bacterium]